MSILKVYVFSKNHYNENGKMDLFFKSRKVELIQNSTATLTNIPHERNDQKIVTRCNRSHARASRLK